MANPKIEVEIGSNIQGLESGVAKAENTLKGIGNAAQVTAPKVQQLARATSNYNGVGVEFSRIIQDAPFGIIGVGNNITQLAGTFQQLRASSSSTGAALKTAFTSIVSPANLVVLGISAVTTALTLYSMGAFSSKNETKELIKEVDRLTEASAEYVKTLNAVDSAQLKGAQNATVEIASLRTLYNATQDTTLSISRRQKAIDTLQEKYPNVFKNIKDETILNGGAKKSYDDLTTSILANARAKAAESTLVENEKKLLALQSERESVNEKIAESEKRSTLELKDQVAVFGQFKTLSQQQTESETRIIEPSLVRRAELGKEINKITSDNLKLVDAIGAENNNIVVELGNAVDTTKDFNKEATALKRTFESISNLPAIGLPRTGDVETLRKRFEQLKAGGQTQLTPQQLLDQAVSNAPGVSGTQPIVATADVFEEQSNRMKSIAEELSSAFGGVGSAIASAFGKPPAFGQFIGTFLAFAAKLVAANFTIAGSNAVVAATSSAVATGPAAAITLPSFIAGALGLVGAAFAAFKGGGSTGGGGGSVGSGVSGQSFTGTGLNAMQSMNIGGEFTVKGSDLVFVLSQEEKKRKKG